MTRINCVPVNELRGKHLLAEYRELPRLYPLVRKAINRREEPFLPSRYTLGPGHVLFFYARLGYVIERQEDLINQMHRRGYTTNFSPPSLDSFPQEWCHDWEPSQEDIALNWERLKERMNY